MQEKTKNIILNLIGILYIILGVGAIINTIYIELGLAPILWLCYIGVILIGIGFLMKNYLLVLSQLNILAIPLLFWNIDFYSILLTGNSLFGITEYFFISGPLIGKIISSQHLFTIPLAIYTIYLIKIKSNAWLISFFQITIVFFITRLISSPDQNINCVFKSCMNIQFTGFYPLIWFIGFFVIIFVTNFILMNILFLREAGRVIGTIKK